MTTSSNKLSPNETGTVPQPEDDVYSVVREIAEAVAPYLIETPGVPANQCRYSLVRRFDETTAEWRATLVAVLPAAFAAAVDDAALNEYDGWESNGWAGSSGADGWRGPRYAVEPSLTSIVALSDNCDRHVLGGWLDESTFALVVVDLEAAVLGGVASIDIDHWHPDSRTSGMYGDTVVICSERVAYVLEREDEDGWYLTLHGVDASSDATVAATLSDLIASVDIFGAEDWVVSLAVFEPDASDDAGLFCVDNPGYDVERCSIVAPDGVWDELRQQHPRPTPEVAREWLDVIEEVVDLAWFDDNPLVVALQAIAEGGEDNQAVQP